jgi:SAM-dependent methyltransferase
LREAPDVLSCFGQLLGGLAPLPGMTVLDFGAGSCWTSHSLAQLGCAVIAMDVSPAMLELGRKRFAEHPLFGERPEATFLLFDGRHIDLPDASVDRILCFDALHHVPNPEAVLTEMARVLRPGGLAGFSEPGPHHSVDAQSQHEMRRYGVVENDVVIEDIGRWAETAGFSEMRIAVFTASPRWVGASELASFLAEGGRPLGVLAHLKAVAREVGHVRRSLRNRRMFLLRKEGNEVTDSRQAPGLAAELRVENLTIEPMAGADGFVVSGLCHIRNSGDNRWLPASAGIGGVLLGLRVGRAGQPAADHGRVALPGGAAADPGATFEVPFLARVPREEPGDLRLELDMVSEGIAWFAEVKGHPIGIPLADAT